jgi:hypothetical protein
MSEKKELSKELKRDWLIFKSLIAICIVVIITGVILNAGSTGICDNCGYETKLRKYKNDMYCEKCYEVISYFDD